MLTILSYFSAPTDFATSSMAISGDFFQGSMSWFQNWIGIAVAGFAIYMIVRMFSH